MTDPLGQIAALCATHGPRLLVQIREKDLPPGQLCAWIAELLPRLNGAQLLINRRVDVALCFEGVGVHLSKQSLSVADARALLGPSRPLGASAHSVEEAIRMRASGANLVTLSPIFETPGKGAPLGLDALRAAAPAGGLYALGGITDAAQIEGTGVEGIAGIRMFFGDAP